VCITEKLIAAALFIDCSNQEMGDKLLARPGDNVASLSKDCNLFERT
jgi:hypothetical protein